MAFVQTRTNAFSDLPFLYISLKTLGGWFDVVADPAIVQETVKVGGIVYGIFWLSAESFPDMRLQKRGLPTIPYPEN